MAGFGRLYSANQSLSLSLSESSLLPDVPRNAKRPKTLDAITRHVAKASQLGWQDRKSTRLNSSHWE